jgi:hypothetical protein
MDILHGVERDKFFSSIMNFVSKGLVQEAST